MTADDSLTTAEITVLLVEPHEICREAVRSLPGIGSSITIVGEAPTIETLGRIDADPAVVLIGSTETTIPQDVEAVRHRFPEARVLVLASQQDGEAAFKAVRAGATGLVPKTADPSEILSAITAVARGEQAFHSDLSAGALLWAAQHETLPAPSTADPPPLTPREREILEHLSEGRSAADIAGRLSLSRRTVEAHLANAYRKLGVHGRIEALREFRKISDVLDRGRPAGAPSLQQ